MLVTVIVATYNSSAFVLDTLESVKKQTYTALELIITDDNSTDNTVSLCQRWCDDNRSFFLNVKLLKSEYNTGISSNVNRGIREAVGKWIKIIAGDDVLMDSCIENNINYVLKHSEISFLFSNVAHIDQFGNNISRLDQKKSFWEGTSQVQYRSLILQKYIPSAPTSFCLKEALYSLELFDESICMCEDYPMWLKATKSGYKLFYMDNITVKYRIHTNSITQKKRNRKLDQSLWCNFKKNVFSDLFKISPFLAIDKALVLFLHSKGFYEDHLFSLILILSPYAIYRRMGRIFDKYRI